MLGACTPGEDAPAGKGKVAGTADEAGAPAATPAYGASLDPAELAGAWRVVALGNAAPRSLDEGRTKPRLPCLLFSGTGYGGTTGCNHFGGLGLLEGGRYYTAPGPQTAMGCGDLMAQEEAITGLLAASPRISRNADGALALAGGGRASGAGAERRSYSSPTRGPTRRDRARPR